jgi:hypothetical protein
MISKLLFFFSSSYSKYANTSKLEILLGFERIFIAKQEEEEK